MRNHDKNERKEFYFKFKVMVLAQIDDIEVGYLLSLPGYQRGKKKKEQIEGGKRDVVRCCH